MRIWQKILNTPLGPLRALSSVNGLCWLAFQEQGESLTTLPARLSRYFPDSQLDNTVYLPLSRVEHWVNQYFLETPDSLMPDCDLQGTHFAKKVWTGLLSVSLGEVKSYSWLAAKLSNPKAVRAVGRALRENPIGLIVPCHRIIGANGSLTGYRGELWRKEWLLNHEQKILGNEYPPKLICRGTLGTLLFRSIPPLTIGFRAPKNTLL